MKNGMTERPNGSKYWYPNDKVHRVDGPAVERANGTTAWCLNGVLHRVDGPAGERANGTTAWYLNGQQVTEEEVMKPLEGLTEEEIKEYVVLMNNL